MSSYLKLFRMLVSTRWPRYLLAGIALFSAVLSAVGALAVRDVKEVSGVIQSDSRTTDAQSNAYQYDTVVFSGSGQAYQVDVTQFSPTLTASDIQPGATVTFWYTQAPLGDPTVTAVQLGSVISGSAPAFVTNAYMHPDDQLTSNLAFAGVCVLLAILAFVAGRFLPASESDAKKKAKSQPAPSWGEIVVGARRPVASPTERAG